jgi:hypothetical protein
VAALIGILKTEKTITSVRAIFSRIPEEGLREIMSELFAYSGQGMPTLLPTLASWM